MTVILGTGDFTHPQWFQALQAKLVPEGTGFYKLKNPPSQLFKGCATDVRFCLTTEISSIYKQGDKVRKNHNLLYAPDLETVAICSQAQCHTGANAFPQATPWFLSAQKQRDYCVAGFLWCFTYLAT